MINYSVIAGYFVFIFIFSLLVVKDSPCSAGAIVTSVCSAGHKITGQAAPKVIPTIYMSISHVFVLWYCNTCARVNIMHKQVSQILRILQVIENCCNTNILEDCPAYELINIR